MTAQPLSSRPIGQTYAIRPHPGRSAGIPLVIATLVFVGGGWSGPTTLTSAAPADVQSTEQLPSQFFGQYCRSCHSGSDSKGDFRVESLSLDFADKQNREYWLNVLDQLETGTMPPPDKPRPDANEQKAMIAWIDGQVAEAEATRQAQQGRAVLRRLNQVQYQNTVRDLLHVDLDLSDLLPADCVAGGFDTSTKILNMSSYQLMGYLSAADRVIDAAIAGHRRPAHFQRRINLFEDSSARRHGVYRHLDDGVAIFSSDLASNIQIVFWNLFTRAPGKYRIRLSAYAYQSEQPVLFHINGGTDNLGDPPSLIGYFDVPPGEPTLIEFVEQMEAGRNIRLLVDTNVRPRDLQRMGGAEQYQGPGLVVQWVEMEGPLLDSWPPPSYRLLFGDRPQARVPDQPDRLEVVSEQPLADAEAILRAFLPRAFRRAVTEDEIQPFLNRVRARLDEGDSFERALRVGLKAVLVSPHFLFHRERVRPPSPSPSNDLPAQPAPLDEYSLANRLSYFLWSSMPDDELFQLAEQGLLSQPDTLREQVERMLIDPRAQAFTENFAGQWLGLTDIDATFPDRQLYPEYDDILRSSMIQEVYLFFDELLRQNLSLANFVSSDFSFLNGRLADHYGIPGVEGLAFRKVDLPPNSPRGGVMTMAAIMKVTANGTTTSPIVRGAWVLDRILGTPPPRPPANIEAVEPDIRGATTIREQLAKHREVVSCASCHVSIDPPGFALENFDVIGGWRDTYRSIGAGEPVSVSGRRMPYRNGPPVDPSDVLPDGRSFRNINEYKNLLLSGTDQLARALASISHGGCSEALIRMP
ncbi:DUF1592 domain-containing protein [Tautonia rosea]|uniref:DUF1592 domain-containing protein n=1 Tax=Tautonia rosea TaxID=2728037 RepID=UPI0014727B0A|nr:DUF1592 domain-containing protein [Tautonia rosea]